MTRTAATIAVSACIATVAPSQEITLADSAGEAEARDLTPLTADAAIWGMTRAEFETAFGDAGFDWNSSAKNTARFAGRGLQLWGEPVGETLVDFKNDTVDRIAISIYNRGDDRDITSDDEFEALVGAWKERIAERTGTEAVDRGRSKTSAVKAEGFLFSDSSTTRLLEWSVQKARPSRDIPFRGEFLKFRLVRTPKDDFFRRHQQSGDRKVSKDDLAGRVRRLENGDVLIPTVPMVDQGSKGYCVVASVERVMRYYGLGVDQHEMAQIASADAGRGTSSEVMVESLKALTGRFHLRVSTHESLDWDEFKKMAKDYNRQAKRADKPEVDPERYMAFVHSLFDAEVLRESRTKSKSDFSRFRRDVVTHIDEGVPLLWSLYMGYFPEEGIPQPPDSGHMRVIIGYNEKTDEIIYSDSWGQGHELKRQPFANAFTSTTGLYTIEPSR